MNELELWESSGPVSPRYQYDLHLKLSGGGQLEISHFRPQPGEEKRCTALAGPDCAAFWSELDALGLASCTTDLVPDSQRVGVSFNRLEVRRDGQPQTGFRYTLAALADHPREKAIIERVKRLV